MAILCLTFACGFEPASLPYNELDGGSSWQDTRGGDVSGDGILGDAGDAQEALAVLPSRGIDEAWALSATQVFVPTIDTIIDTTDGTIDGVAWPGIFRAIGPADCAGYAVSTAVFAFDRVHIAAGVTVRVQGDRAIAMLARNAIIIDGVFDASGGVDNCGTHGCAGPGGFAGGFPNNPGDRGGGPGGGEGGAGVESVGNETGGGGGGHGAVGGAGGNEVPGTLMGGAGGLSYRSKTTLCGGSGGGGGGIGYPRSYPPVVVGASGGGGGGAVQLVSLVRIGMQTGMVLASGGGGEGDHISTFDDGAGGGGAGGSILLEAPSVVLGAMSILAANGGGGGGGYMGGVDTEDGSTGLQTPSAAPGGLGGGEGGFLDEHSGASAIPGPDGTGGGGGAAGRIDIRQLGGGSGALLFDGLCSPRAVRND